MNRTLAPLGLIITTVLLTACAQLPLPMSKETTITLNPGITYQIITGWEAVAEIGNYDFPKNFQAWQKETLDLAVDDLGINRIRLAIRSGSESPEDYFTPYFNGEADFERFVETRYATVSNPRPELSDSIRCAPGLTYLKYWRKNLVRLPALITGLSRLLLSMT